MSTITIQIDNNQPIRSISVEFYKDGSVSSSTRELVSEPTTGEPICSTTYPAQVTGVFGGNYNPLNKINEDDYLASSTAPVEEVLVVKEVPKIEDRPAKIDNNMNDEV